MRPVEPAPTPTRSSRRDQKGQRAHGGPANPSRDARRRGACPGPWTTGSSSPCPAAEAQLCGCRRGCLGNAGVNRCGVCVWATDAWVSAADAFSLRRLDRDPPDPGGNGMLDHHGPGWPAAVPHPRPAPGALGNAGVNGVVAHGQAAGLRGATSASACAAVRSSGS
jgi:hypothetical protein